MTDRKIIEYGLICNPYNDYLEFKRNVERRLKEGYELLGGASIGSCANSTLTICQTVVKYE